MSEKIYSKTFEAGEDIIRIGDAGRNAYFIENGAVEVTLPGKDGIKVLAKMGKGEIFGEMSIIDDAPRSATVTAKENTEVIVIELSRYMQSLESSNPMMHLILRLVLSRFRQAGPQTNDGITTSVTENNSMNEIRSLALEKIRFEREMRDGLKAKEFEIHYQPIISLKDGKIAGFEALMRWYKGNKFISPGHFIPLAEETGLIVELGRVALTTGLQDHIQFTNILEENSAFMSINLSGLQISELGEIEHLAAIIKESDLIPAQIKLEVTETLMLEDFLHAKETLEKFKNLGVSIALDDFGTGFSSLSYLHQLPLDTLKIDQAFVNDMNKTKKSMRVVESIASLALSLNMNIVAEGIENKDQYIILKDLGCQFGQGYYMSRPLPKEEIQKLLLTRPTW
ncbi:EAL domain-containing protein [Rhodospirillales bacterium]|nr:EAL domain-containing protein [Rhodospirillales bacterium]